jgi:excisionase family DNA binding protein
MTGEPQTLQEVARFAVIERKTICRLTGLGKNTVNAMIDRGEIPSVTVGRRVLVPTVPFLELFGAGHLCQGGGNPSADGATPSHRVMTHAGVNPSDNGAAGTAPSRAGGDVVGVPHGRD